MKYSNFQVNGVSVRMSLIVALFFMVISAGYLCSSAMAESMKISAEPSEFKISAFYNGAVMHVTGEIPKGTEVAVRVKGAGTEVHLKKKGKVGGVLWMNTGKVIFKNVPDVFMLYTTQALVSKLDDPALNLGYWSVRDEIEMEPATEDKKFLFGEFIKLNEANKVYLIDKDSVTYGDAGGMRKFSVDVRIPPKMKPGKYQVEAFAVRDATVVASATAPFSLEQTGLPRWISELAFNHALLFGIMSVFVAIAAGLAIGMIFRGGGGAH